MQMCLMIQCPYRQKEVFGERAVWILSVRFLKYTENYGGHPEDKMKGGSGQGLLVGGFGEAFESSIFL